MHVGMLPNEFLPDRFKLEVTEDHPMLMHLTFGKMSVLVSVEK